MVRVYKGLVACIALLLFLGGRAHACGYERWAAKVLGDGSGLSAHSITVDVDYLRSLPRPYGVDGTQAARTVPERQLYTVHGELLGFKLENDGDIHAVIAQRGNTQDTIIAEIPDPHCMLGAPQSYINAVAGARLAFVKAFGIPPYRTFRLAYAPVTVTGALFFDFEHGQDGSAPNLAELHPVMAVNASGSITAPASVPAASGASSPISCPGDVAVWVNTRSGVYHLPGSRYYGNTRRGEYMCRRAADAAGYRVAENGQ